MPAIVRWSSRASPIPRVGSSCRSRRRNSASSSSVGQDVGPEGGEPLVEARARLGHQLEHRAAELDHVLPVAGASRARPTDGAGPSGRTRQEPVMRRCEWMTRSPSKRRKRCLPWASTERTDAPGQPLGPAVAAEARVRRRDLVRHVPFEHRPDPAAPRSGSCRPRACHAQGTGGRDCGTDQCGRSIRVVRHGCARLPARAVHRHGPPRRGRARPRASGSCSSTRSSSARWSAPSSNAQVIAAGRRPAAASTRRPALSDLAQAPQRARPPDRHALLRRQRHPDGQALQPRRPARLLRRPHDHRRPRLQGRQRLHGAGGEIVQQPRERHRARRHAASACSRSTCRSGSRPAARRPACSRST